MTIQKVASEIAKREGKKSQARIGDIREMLKALCVMEAEAAVANSESPLGAIDDQVDKILAKLKKKLAKSKARGK